MNCFSSLLQRRELEFACAQSQLEEMVGRAFESLACFGIADDAAKVPVWVSIAGKCPHLLLAAKDRNAVNLVGGGAELRDDGLVPNSGMYLAAGRFIPLWRCSSHFFSGSDLLWGHGEGREDGLAGGGLVVSRHRTGLNQDGLGRQREHLHAGTVGSDEVLAQQRVASLEVRFV